MYKCIYFATKNVFSSCVTSHSQIFGISHPNLWPTLDSIYCGTINNTCSPLLITLHHFVFFYHSVYTFSKHFTDPSSNHFSFTYCLLSKPLLYRHHPEFRIHQFIILYFLVTLLVHTAFSSLLHSFTVLFFIYCPCYIMLCHRNELILITRIFIKMWRSCF